MTYKIASGCSKLDRTDIILEAYNEIMQYAKHIYSYNQALDFYAKEYSMSSYFFQLCSDMNIVPARMLKHKAADTVIDYYESVRIERAAI